jgi:hypothetical protein
MFLSLQLKATPINSTKWLHISVICNNDRKVTSHTSKLTLIVTIHLHSTLHTLIKLPYLSSQQHGNTHNRTSFTASCHTCAHDLHDPCPPVCPFAIHNHHITIILEGLVACFLFSTDCIPAHGKLVHTCILLYRAFSYNHARQFPTWQIDMWYVALCMSLLYILWLYSYYIIWHMLLFINMYFHSWAIAVYPFF